MKTICVLGLGYIGLPTASVLATNGFEVFGVDIDEHVVDTVNEGNIHIEEPGLQTIVRAATQSGNLRAGLTPKQSDVYIVAVPTPLTSEKRADMRFVRRATEEIVPLLAPGALVILESTSPPGTCRDLLVPILESSGLKVGDDIFLAHCPERVLPGQILREFIDNDRTIGGFDAASAACAAEVYEMFVEGALLLTDMTTAEMSKVLENTYRDVNIALANETAILCEKLGINFWEVAALTNRHPRVNLHQAGPGVGGHCIAVDPWFLVDAFPDDTPMISLARGRNDGMPEHVVSVIQALVDGVENPKVAMLGLAFKRNVDDIRESPALKVLALLASAGIEVAAHDPHVKSGSIAVSSFEGCVRDADCLVLLTDHNEYKLLDAAEVGGLMRRRVVFDTRNLLALEAWRGAGFEVRLLGAGDVS